MCIVVRNFRAITRSRRCAPGLFSGMSTSFRLGAFILFALLIFAGGVFWIGNQHLTFASTYHLSADFPNVSGLNEAAEVRVGGIPEGTVRRIDLPRKPGEKVRVEMDLKVATRGVVKKDSIAAIQTEGLIGDKYVEVSFGSDQAENIKNGDVIGSEPPLDISDLMKKTSGILESAQDAMQNVDETAGNLKLITTKINQGRGTVGALINDKSVYQNANQATAALQDDAEALKHNFLLKGFFKNRGYEDTTDLKKNQIAQVPSGAPAKTFTYDAKKIFDKPDTAKLKDSKVLNESGMYLEQNPFGLAVVASQADMKGDSDKSKMLTEARAMVVRDYLVKNFKLEDSRIKIVGQGKVADAPDGGAVEILIYPVGTNVPASPTPSAAKR